MDFASLSSNLLFVSFFAYLIATLFFGGAVKGAKSEVSYRNSRSGLIGIIITIIGFLTHVGYFITRWMASGHAPVSNMFEAVTALGMMLVLAFIILYLIYKTPSLGLFALPIAIVIIGYASMFPTEVTPLIPALKTKWLAIHVITTILGEAILAISAVAGLVLLIKEVDVKKPSRERFWLEVIVYTVVLFIGFIAVTTGFRVAGYEAEFTFVDKNEEVAAVTYNMPPLFGMNEYEAQTEGTMKPWAEMPTIVDAKKLTTSTWSFFVGTALYLLLRLIFRRPISAVIKPWTKNTNTQLMDEVGYRAVLIGFPVFSLGGLVFAMIWAHEAWSRFWGWDPKEVWALITWLFYAAFLHLRLTRGWEGKKSAWLMVIGFILIMFNFIAVNMILAGLHSYA